MVRPEARYTLYHGDTFIAEGTAKELAEIEGVTPKTISFYSTPVYMKRGHRKKVYKIDDTVQVDITKLKALLTRHGYHTNDLADVLGFTSSTISRRLNGLHPFREEEVEILADLLFVDSWELYEGEGGADE